MVKLFTGGSKSGKSAAQPTTDAAATPAKATATPPLEPSGAKKPAAAAAVAAPLTVKVKVPPGGKPGKQIAVDGPDGHRHVIKLPPSAKPGAVIEVEVPPPDARAVRFEADDASKDVPIAAEVVPEKSSGQAPLFGVSSEEPATSAGKATVATTAGSPKAAPASPAKSGGIGSSIVGKSKALVAKAVPSSIAKVGQSGDKGTPAAESVAPAAVAPAVPAATPAATAATAAPAAPKPAAAAPVSKPRAAAKPKPSPVVVVNATEIRTPRATGGGGGDGGAYIDPVVRKAFAHFDVDASGDIDAAELRPALARLGMSADAAEAKAILQGYDTHGDADGCLDLIEFAQLVQRLLAWQAEQAGVAPPPPVYIEAAAAPAPALVEAKQQTAKPVAPQSGRAARAARVEAEAEAAEATAERARAQVRAKSQARGQAALAETEAKRAATEAAAVAAGDAPARGPAFAGRARRVAGGSGGSGGGDAGHAAAASARSRAAQSRRALPLAERRRHKAATRLQRAWRGLLARRRYARTAWRAAAGVGADTRALEMTLVSLDGADDAEEVAVRLSLATLPPVIVQQARPWVHAVALQAGTQPLAAIRDALLPHASGSDGGAAATRALTPSQPAPPPRAVSAEVKRAFAHFDVDNSGGIDAVELTAALAQLGVDASHDEAAGVLARYDDAEAGDAGRSGRRDGKLDVYELQALVDDLIHFQQAQQAAAQGLPPPPPPPSRQRTHPPPQPAPEGGPALPLTIELLRNDGAVVAAEATLDLATVAVEYASSAVATYEVPMSDGSAATLSLNVSQALLPLMRIGRAFAAADERGVGVLDAVQAEAAAAALGLPQAAALEDEMDVLRFERWVGEMAPLQWRRDELPGGRGGKGRGPGGGGAVGAGRPMLVQHKQTLELRDGENASFVVDGASELQLLSVRQMRAPSALRLLLGAADASAASGGVAHAAAASHAAVEAAATGGTGSGGGDGAVLYDGAAYAHRGAGALVKGGDAWVFPGGRCYELAVRAPLFSPALPPPQSAAAEAATIVRGGGRVRQPPPPPLRGPVPAAEATLLVAVRVVSRVEAGSGLEIIDEPTHKLLLPSSRQRPASAATTTRPAASVSIDSVSIDSVSIDSASTKATVEAAKLPRPTSACAAAPHARHAPVAASATAGNVTVGVTCPAGCKAGDAIQVEHGGRMFDLVVPAGVVAGQSFDAVLPIAAPQPSAGAAGDAAVSQAAAKARGTKALPLGKAAQAAVRRASAAVHPAPPAPGTAAAPAAAAVFGAPRMGSAWGGGAVPLGAAPLGAAGGAWSGAAGATAAAGGWAGYMPALGLSGGGSGGAPWAHAPPSGGVGAAGAHPTQQRQSSALRHAFDLFCEGGGSLSRASLSRAVRRIGVTLTYRALDLFNAHAAPESGGDSLRFEGFAALVSRLEAEGAFAQAEQEAACCATVASKSASSSSGRGGGGGGPVAAGASGTGGAAGRCDGASLLEAAAVSLEYGGRGGRLTVRQLRAVLRTLGLRLEGAEAKATLAKFDADLDGELDVFELGKLLHALHAQQAGVATAGAAASQLIYGGGTSAPAAPPPPPVATLRAAFGALDVRGDGTIPAESLRAALARAGVDAGHAAVQSTLWELQLRGTTAVDFATFHRVAHAVALDARTAAPTPPAGVPYVAPHFQQPIAAQPLPPSQFAPSGVNPPYPFTSPGVYPPTPQQQPPHPGYAQPPPGLVANPYAPQQQQAWWQPPSQSGAAGWPQQAWGAPHPQSMGAPPWAVREAADRYGTRGERPAAVGRQAGGWWGSGPPLPHSADIELDPALGPRPEPLGGIDWRKYEAAVPYAPPSPTSKAERARREEKKKTEGQRAESYRAAYALPRDDKTRTAKGLNKSPSCGRKR